MELNKINPPRIAPQVNLQTGGLLNKRKIFQQDQLGIGIDFNIPHKILDGEVPQHCQVVFGGVGIDLYIGQLGVGDLC